jgi:uncharacterized protein YjdB
MKQNKRFLLLVVMVLLANCLFAGLATAEVSKVTGLYVVDPNYDGITLTSASEIKLTVPAAQVASDGTLNNTIPLWLNFQQITAGNKGSLEKSDPKNREVMVAYVSTETAGEVAFVVSTEDTAKATVLGGDKRTGEKAAGAKMAIDPASTYSSLYLNVKKTGTVKITIAAIDNDAAWNRDIAAAGGTKSVTFTVNVVKQGASKVSLFTKSKNLEYTVGDSVSTCFFASDSSTYVNTADWDAVIPAAESALANKDHLEFVSDNTKVAIWNKDTEKFTFLAEGTAVITAQTKEDKAIKDSIKITVKKAGDKPIDSVTFTPAEFDYDKMKDSNGNVDLSKYVGVKPSKDDGYCGMAKRVWTVDNEEIGKVDKNGVFTAAGTGKNGKVVVTMTETDKLGNTKSGTVTVTVANQITKLEKVTLDPKEATIYYLNKDEKTTTSLSATTSQIATGSSSLTWKWSTSDATIAIVSGGAGSAAVVPTGVGTAIITCEVSDGTTTVKATAKITVDGKGEGPAVKVTDANNKKSSTVYLKKGEESKLTLKANAESVEWSSENDKIATVKDGVVTIVGKGKVHIIAKTADGNVGIYGINAKAKAAKITIKNKEVKVNKSKKLYTIAKDAYDATVTVTVAKPEVLKVNADGTMEGLAKGSTKVTIKTADQTKTVTVKVKK